MKHKFSLYAVLFVCLTAVILLNPEKCLAFSLNGLNLWFQKMIPALFPFMVLSGIMIRMDLISPCVKVLMPVFGRLFHTSPACVYGILVGFLCGFPMGAHTAAQLYENGQISKDEASFLLAFCNNIGPVYFLSFVIPALGIASPGLYLFGMYGLPFLYGLVLRYTAYSDRINPSVKSYQPDARRTSFACALDLSIENALLNMARLGGYMVVFNLLFILPSLCSELLSGLPQIELLTGSICCLLEITGGISVLGKGASCFVLCILPFGGLSCTMQTYSMIRSTDLSLTEYLMHKAILTAVTVVFYLAAVNQFFLP
ncbi:MAG: hypothetical protein NC429_01445 [Lachnospiraceae bacterium]|nr:hypothetical protein [Lachnospiraceae bacterium]